jgi:PPOX class probable F420-dependent enzyme
MSAALSPEARRFLEEQRFAVLATINRDGTPQQSTVWYELQGDEIMMNTRRGRRKDRNVRRDPRVSICIEDEYRYLAIGGTVTVIDDQAIALPDIQRLAVRYHGRERGERQFRDEFAGQTRVTFRLVIERVDEYELG